jgi:hypothetical protein
MSSHTLFIHRADGTTEPASSLEILTAARAVLAHRVRRSALLGSPRRVGEYLAVRLGHLDYECFGLVLVDGRHRIAQILSQEGAGTAVSPELRAVTRLCETVRTDTKALRSANEDSWEIGRPPNAPPSYRNGGGRGARATGRRETGRLELS